MKAVMEEDPRDRLIPGTRLLLQWGGNARPAVIVARDRGRYAVKIDCGPTEVMDVADLNERKFMVMPPRPPTLWQRLCRWATAED